MRKYFYDPPAILKKMMNNYIWESGTDKILITFDDGPNPLTTEKILKKLNRYKIKSVFFCVGENAEKYPGLVNEISAEGHLIGNHTYSHKKLSEIKKVEIYQQIKKCSEVLENNTVKKINYFRPPYGRSTFGLDGILKTFGLTGIMWSLITYDYESNFKKVKFAVDNYLKKNSVVVFHDSNKTETIIENSIDYLVNKSAENNFNIGSPGECLK